MSFDLSSISSATPVARVVIAAIKGSSPREVGASMLVTADNVSGTIGGGALEFEAIRIARNALEARKDGYQTHALGPSMGQCCGGSVSLLTEIWDESRISTLQSALVVRPLPGAPSIEPLEIKRLKARFRSQGQFSGPGIIAGWMVEKIVHPSRELWIWGAGHVGRAITSVLSPMPDLNIIWADTVMDRYPADIPAGVLPLTAENLPDLVRYAPDFAEHLVLTYSHAFDLEICHRLLHHRFGRLGLIGSATKKARFRSRLRDFGHSIEQIDRIQCPIGDTSLGKDPQSIAIGVANDILRRGQGENMQIGIRA